MAWCLKASSHHLKQCWLLINKVQWHSSDSNFTWDTTATTHRDLLGNENMNLPGASELINTVRSEQSGWQYFRDDIFKWDFVNEKHVFWIISSSFSSRTFHCSRASFQTCSQECKCPNQTTWNWNGPCRIISNRRIYKPYPGSLRKSYRYINYRLGT